MQTHNPSLKKDEQIIQKNYTTTQEFPLTSISSNIAFVFMDTYEHKCVPSNPLNFQMTSNSRNHNPLASPSDAEMH